MGSTPFVPIPTSILDELEFWAKEAAKAHGLELFDVEVSTHGKNQIRIFVDKADASRVPGTGIKVEDCVRVNRYMEALLDAEEHMPERYALEVSSPGVERALKKVRHWELSLGDSVRAVLNEADEDGEVVVEGVLLSCSDGVVELDVQGASELRRLRLDDIKRARVTYDFDAD